MKKSLYNFLIVSILLLPSFVFAQVDVIEKFNPLPKGIEKITGLQYTIYQGDTTSENFSEYRFDKNGNTVSWEYFPYYVKEIRKYDSLDRIIEIEGLYGESLGNGVITYQYPSKNQKIEIHDQLGYYKYIKSELFFDSNDRIIKEIKQDSTFNLMDSTLLVSKIDVVYLYHKNGNLEEEFYSTKVDNEIIYTHKTTQIYDNEKLVERNTHFYKKNTSDDYFTNEVKKFSYVKEGKFKGRIEKEVDFITSKTDTIKSEISYTYQEIDSNTISKESKQSYHTDPLYLKKYIYQNNHLIKLEEYSIPKEENEKAKLSSWTEYTYFFYPKVKE